MRQQLMTKEIEKALEKHPLDSQDGRGGKSKVVVKYFGGSGVWLITGGQKEPDGDWTLYGLVTVGYEDNFHPGYLLWEWGFVMLSELARQPCEVVMDTWVNPGKLTVNDLVFDCFDYGRGRR